MLHSFIEVHGFQVILTATCLKFSWPHPRPSPPPPPPPVDWFCLCKYIFMTQKPGPQVNQPESNLTLIKITVNLPIYRISLHTPSFWGKSWRKMAPNCLKTHKKKQSVKHINSGILVDFYVYLFVLWWTPFNERGWEIYVPRGVKLDLYALR